MRITVLGAHQIETKTTRCYSILIDGVLAIDAGALASSLRLEEQAAVRYLLVTHRHFDHVKDIASVGFNTAEMRTLEIYGSAGVRDTLLANILNGTVWPDLTRFPSEAAPAVRFTPLEAGEETAILDYRISARPSIHSVPTAGYLVESDGSSAYFTSDTGQGSGAIWARMSPQLLVTEVTVSDRLADVALRAGHLTPGMLRTELEAFVGARGYCPRVVITHVNPLYQGEIDDELQRVAHELHARIEVAHEGMEVVA